MHHPFQQTCNLKTNKDNEPSLQRKALEPAHVKTYNKTCVTSKDLDWPVHPSSMARVILHPSLDNLEAVEGTCDQRRL